MFCRNLGVSFWGEHDLNSLLEILCSVKTLVYPFELSMISGARYQRVATYSVKKPVWSWSGSCVTFFQNVSKGNGDGRVIKCGRGPVTLFLLKCLGNDDGMVLWRSFTKCLGNDDGMVDGHYMWRKIGFHHIFGFTNKPTQTWKYQSIGEW